jgi:hypothetical protein
MTVPNIPRCWSCCYHSTIVSFCVNNYLCILSDVHYLLDRYYVWEYALILVSKFTTSSSQDNETARTQGRTPVLPCRVQNN